jgi:hypothetical protein
MINFVFRIEGGAYGFDKRAPRKAFGPTKDEETGESRRLHTVKIHDLYFTAYTLVGKF